MVNFYLDSNALQGQDHLRANVLELVHWRYRKITLFVAGLVAEVRSIRGPLFTRVPEAGIRVDVVVAEVITLIKADLVQEKELQLGTNVYRIRETDLLDVGFSLLRDVSRIAAVGVTGYRIFDVADQDQRGHRRVGVHHRRGRVWEQQHVGFIDRLKSADRRSVESDSFLEQFFAEFRDRNRKVLPEPGKIDEPQVYDLRIFLFRQLNHVLRGHAGPPCRHGALRCAR